jgi:AcrR family transcriptional regulator
VTAKSTAAQPRQRRTQAERTRETRGKLLAAAARLIARGGYGAGTLAEIARDAELTKGAIQYHFADKRELDAAIYVQGYTELVKRFGEITAAGDLQARVGAVIDSMYEAYSSELVQAAMEVDRAWRKEPPPVPEKVEEIFSASTSALDRQWRALFPDVKVSNERVLQCRRLARIAIQGQVARDANGVPDDAPLDRDTLKAAIVYLLTTQD